jgi:hypothetical protein
MKLRRKMHTGFAQKPEDRRPVGRARQRWEGCIGIDFKETR